MPLFTFMEILCLPLSSVSTGSIIFMPILKAKLFSSWQHSNCHISIVFIVTRNIIGVFPSIKHFGGKNNKEEKNESFISEWGHFLNICVQFQPHLGIANSITCVMSACNFFFTHFSKEQETSVFFSLFTAPNPTDRCFQNQVVCEHLKEYYICINAGNSKLRAFHTVLVFQINIFLFCARHFVLLLIKQTLCAHIC